MKNIRFQHPIGVISGAAAVGFMEKEGALGSYFDLSSDDDTFGEKSWEAAESRMVTLALEKAISACKWDKSKPDFIMGGDLLNQCTASAYGAQSFLSPYLGLYGACSTFAESLLLGGALLESSGYRYGCVFASSHFSSAERQYRYPLEYGCQRTPTAQRTVTGCGAAVIGKLDRDDENAMVIRTARPGVIVDSGVKDANHMGAAMAPAAADTLISFLKEEGRAPSDYDLILTGDLGRIGAELFTELCVEKGILLGAEYFDIGTRIFSEDQDVHAGASGCGCSAIYLCGYLTKVWKTYGYRRVLLIGTGALLSPLTVQQKHTISGIGHLIEITKGAFV